jgi:alpha-tubulin suppressor-like RCC1 family protein
VCGAGTCQAGCYVGGVVYATGGLNPANACQSCAPSISTMAWYQAPADCATIAAHVGFTCATVGGVAKCWGSNSSSSGRFGCAINGDGFLGIGQTCDQTPYSTTPLAVSSLGAGVIAVSAGSDSLHACALANGAVKCWGANSSGQIGDGSNSNRNAPVQVSGLASGVQGIATGNYHSCALVNGQVQCWGNNGGGQLGLDPSTTTGTTTPAGIPLSGNIQSITTGSEHTCALVGGSVWCWGSNTFGELGNNSTTGSYVPVQPSGLGSNIQAVAAGSIHTCAIANGSLYCWGDNSSGQLGDGTTAARLIPVPVQGLASGVQAVTTGGRHTCALVNGGAWCWGLNSSGQLGDNTTTDRWSPVAVQGLGSGVQAITAGSNHSCALTSAGAKCWGNNSSGQLGNNSTTDSSVPVAVQGF